MNGYPRPGLRDDSKEQHPPKKYASTTRVRTRAKNNIYIYIIKIYIIYIYYISYEFTIYQSSTIHFVVCLGTQGCSCVGKKTRWGESILQSWETNHHTHSPFFTGIAKEKKPLSTTFAWDGLGTYHISGVLDFLPLKISFKSLIHSQKNMFLS